MSKLINRKETKTRMVCLDKKTSICTRCCRDMECFPRFKEWWKGIALGISLCLDCSAIVAKKFIDRTIEGTDQQIEIDRLTKFGQK